MRLDGLVELLAVERLHQLDGLCGRIQPLAIDLGPSGSVALAVLRHYCPSTSTPIERAVPAITFIAWSTSRIQVRHLRLGDLTHLRLRQPADLVRFGSPDPFSIRSASLISTAAGGVFVMNVNERSSKTEISTG